MKRFLLATSLFLACSLLSNPAAAQDKKKITIAVIPKGTTHEFWKSVHAGANKAAKEFNVEVIWKGPLKEDDREAQISVVEDFITRGVTGICLAPLDDTALRAPVREAVKSKIPVVVFDSDLKSDEYVSFVATDNYVGGKLAGERLAKLLGGKGKVAMLRYQEGSASTANREKGFMDALKAYPEIEVISENQYGGATTESAQKASENLLSSLKGKAEGAGVDGIYCPNESTTFGMLRALQNAGLAGKVKLVGFDASAKLVEGLRNEQIHGLVLQNPIQMGYLSVKTMVDHLGGKKVEKRIDTGATMVTKENMEEPANKELLQPDLEKWLGKE
jgi:ribose transport system substrate-binding protein